MFKPDESVPVTGATKSPEREIKKIGELIPLDLDYFHELEGADGWIAIGQDNCANQRYFTVMSDRAERLGIVGVYDTEEDKNITHSVVDPKYRGQGLSNKFLLKIMDQLGLDHFIGTVDADNAPSIRAIEKMPGVKKISDEEYEAAYHKYKYRYDRPEQ